MLYSYAALGHFTLYNQIEWDRLCLGHYEYYISPLFLSYVSTQASMTLTYFCKESFSYAKGRALHTVLYIGALWTSVVAGTQLTPLYEYWARQCSYSVLQCSLWCGLGHFCPFVTYFLSTVHFWNVMGIFYAPFNSFQIFLLHSLQPFVCSLPISFFPCVHSNRLPNVWNSKS